MDKRAKVSVAALSLSAAGFLSLLAYEGYTDKAVIPTKGDVPTVGFGTTVYPDGRRVQMGDTITPVNALQVAKAHIDKDERAFRASLPGAFLSQTEYDLYLDFAYQYGRSAWARSSMRREILAGNHRGACQALLKYRFVAGYDCSTPGNKRCMGVWTRQVQRYEKCMEVQ